MRNSRAGTDGAGSQNLPAPPPAPSQAHAPKPAESAPDDLGNPEFSARQTLNGPVRSLGSPVDTPKRWRSSTRYWPTDPDNEDARSWKKKIREAQAAEAALK